MISPLVECVPRYVGDKMGRHNGKTRVTFWGAGCVSGGGGGGVGGLGPVGFRLLFSGMLRSWFDSLVSVFVSCS